MFGLGKNRSTEPIRTLKEQIALQRMQLEYDRSAVRRRVTYWMMGIYLAIATALITIFLYLAFISDTDDIARNLYLQTALAVFSGVSAAALGVIGYWFGNREASRQSHEILTNLNNTYSAYRESLTTTPPRPGSTPPANEVTSSLARGDIFQKAKSEFLSGRYGDNVIGVSIGEKFQSGHGTNIEAVRIHVTRKYLEEDLPDGKIIPGEFMGLPTDVVVTNTDIQSCAEPDDIPLPPLCGKLKVIQPGICFGLAGSNGQKGTIGAIVRTRDDAGKLYAMTAGHVVGQDNKDFPVTQPYGRSSKKRKVGIVNSVFPDIDVALVELLPEHKSVCDIAFNIAGIPDPIIGDVAARKGDRVTKVGAQTGRTCGIIEGPCSIKSSHSNRQIDGYHIAPIGVEVLAAQGDSGACWFESASHAGVGIHIGAMSCDGNFRAIAVPLSTALEKTGTYLVKATNKELLV